MDGKEMEFDRYYVVEVSLFPNNSVHRAIACNARWDRDSGYTVDLLCRGYESGGTMRQSVNKLAYFRIVDEVGAMSASRVTFRDALRALEAVAWDLREPEANRNAAVRAINEMLKAYVHPSLVVEEAPHARHS